MLEKIIELKGVGLLHDPISAELPLKELAVFYAENGRGKSTFANICRSLSSGDNQLVQIKKSAKRKLEPKIVFQINGSTHTFDENGWNKPFSDIIIFDSEFIERNLYSGSKIDPIHKENLLEFSLGEADVKTKKDIDELAEKIENINKQTRPILQTLEKILPSDYTLESFLSLETESNALQFIEDLQKKLTLAEKVDQVKARPEFTKIVLPEIPTDDLIIILAKSLDEISDDAEKKLRDHILSHNMGELGESWIKQGIPFIQNNQCPFCAQPINSLDIIKSYKDYFNQQYQEFKDKIKDIATHTEGLLSEESIDKVRSLIEKNDRTKEVWQDHEIIKLQNRLEADKVISPLRKIKTEIINVLTAKANSPFSSFSITSTLDLLSILQKQISLYNQEIEIAVLGTEKAKKDLSDLKSDDLKREIKKYEVHDKRMSVEVSTLCADILDARKQKDLLEKQKEELRENLNAQTKLLLGKYEGKINALLKSFSTNFSIKKMGVKHQSGTARTEYFIEILGEQIPLSLSAKETGKNLTLSAALSDGDKRSLALAFFLARMEDDNNLDKKIIVIDDPVASLDTGRRQTTIRKLVELTTKCKQIILLSHDINFLQDFIKNVTKKKMKSKLCEFQISRFEDYSKIDVCEISKVIEDPFLVNYRTLETYYNIGAQKDQSLLEIPHIVRDYVEGLLINKFPLDMIEANSLGKMISIIQAKSGELRFSKICQSLNDLKAINDYTSPFVHSSLEKPEDPKDGEMRQLVQVALELGWGIR